MVEAEGDTNRMMHQAERYWFPLRQRIYCHILSVDGDIRSSKVLESCHDRDAAGVDQAAIIVEDMYICTNRPAFCAGNDAKRLGVYGIGASNCFF